METNGQTPGTRFAPADVLVVGAGPIGLACALEVQRAGRSARVVEKGALVHSIIGYPTGMEFFSTPELLEIGGHPLPTARYKPVREEAIDYYQTVARRERLDVRLYERVLRVDGEDGAFEVVSTKGVHACRKVVVATGFFDQPNRLGVPGEALPHVSHYYKEPYPFAGQRVVVVGAKNSSAKAALDLYRHGAAVTLVHRGPEVGPSVKYWIRPDLLNRIRDGVIAAHFHTTVTAIRPGEVDVSGPDGPATLPADFVLALTGYHPDFAFLETLGVRLEGPLRVPVCDAETMETNRPGLYLAGTVCGGYDTSRWFIENGRIHAARLAAHLTGR
ncbi:MAG TPA: YpdA family putative bacillithiol disulfide reductase, partial [Anaeromyxobacteraceae bacterium]|nr:YpdA family putative bacillithiol disulfide reductase [Anaeromyxobacteraceae bacterium]